MSDAASRTVELLGDPDLWERVEGIPVFDEHEEEGEDGKKVVFDEKLLRKYAANCNRRQRETGDLTPITLGHTRRGAREEDQPRVVGFAGDYRVGRFGPGRKLGVLATFYLRKDEGGRRLLREFPRRSVERWTEDEIFDPIALLRRTPRRDLGLTYERVGRNVVRYSRDFDMADEPITTDAAEDRTGEDEKLHEDYMRHCYGHPYARQYHEHHLKKYGMPEEPVDGADASEPVPPPHEEPDGDEPESYAAAPAFAAPSATNGALPARKKPATAYARDGSPVADVRESQLAQRWKRLEARLDALESENKRLKGDAEKYARQADESDVTAILKELTADDVDFDAEVEFPAFLALPKGERRKAKADYMRKHYAKVGEPGGARVRTERGPAQTPAGARERREGAGVDLSDPDSWPQEDQQAAAHYMRENNRFDLSPAEALKLARPEKYGKNGAK